VELDFCGIVELALVATVLELVLLATEAELIRVRTIVTVEVVAVSI